MDRISIRQSHKLHPNFQLESTPSTKEPSAAVGGNALQHDKLQSPSTILNRMR